ncbi:short-chain dehydrogenase/reductase SDR [Dinoroseobacter shibae DFL 12 = DSM 16493]|uniref:Short-chain dehydrogenase/reductase SDR n=2 Tax=Pseudomonadota TaxID=1224 RepID=A8LMX6_DINSH|nr:SDR family NAD(P)-dependent oxidoreductase [Dinoroseobacter shibae]ABV92120.1 short-chain dehydrogenase/reductase SDR [Dinoroseobacter shibae DFL 12 = DSM 16493]URF47078.1 SDR family NAD(P)-dependent oxidoreductase [Dinoroseobacter shibae]URF51389.1 SDR family NAD(P)-dependent oxidoreductase [Dinoroseobacter shibae]
MRELTGKRYWLVGASEGLGRALAEHLSRMGVELVLSARSEDRLKELAESLPGKAHAVPVDISDTASVTAAAEAAGQIDGMVFLAGVYWPLKATEWDAEKVEAMCDINFTGAARCVGAVLPGMVARDAGHIVLTGSLSGFRGLPGASGYGPSKAGVMAMAEAMHCDLRKTGVDVQVANPGFIRTRLTEKNDFNMPFLMEPEDAAREMVELMLTDSFKRSFPTVFASFFRLSQFLPDWAYYRIFA